MASNTRTLVPAAAVREWARENTDLLPEGCPTGFMGETARGVIPPAAVAAFRKHNRRKDYQPKAVEGGQVTITVPAKDSAGRNRSRKVTLTHAEARKVMGDAPGKRGRISVKRLTDAYVAANPTD